MATEEKITEIAGFADHALFGYSTGELKKLVQEGLESGASSHFSMNEIKAEARRRLKASLPDKKK